MIAFGDLKTETGLSNLDNFLAERSYLDGHVPSQADRSIFEAIGNAPNSKYSHVLRWFNHIVSYGEEKSRFPAASKPLPKQESTPVAKDDEDNDEDVDLFGSDDEEEDADAARVREERLKAYADKKSKKPGPIAKSQILLDCKPWDDETDMKEMENLIRTIEMDGLIWGASKLNPLAYGIMKLSILCTVEDEKVSVDDLTEKITEFEDFVQSVDIAAFNKV